MTTEKIFLTAWDWNPTVIAVGIGTLAAYGWHHGGHNGFRFRGKIGWLLAGVLVFFLTLASPIDALADGYLFSAHMLQHILLLLIVPPLLLLSLPLRPDSDGGGKWMKSILKRPFVTWLLGVGGMWLWHIPALCNAAVSNPWIHRLQYVSLLAMGAAFWWPIFGPRARQRLRPLAGIIYLFTACLSCTVLGIIITFAPVSVCPIFMHPQDPLGILSVIQNQWGLTPAKDQQLGGLLMWVPACLIYLTGIFALIARWYGETEDETGDEIGNKMIVPQSQVKPTHVDSPYVR